MVVRSGVVGLSGAEFESTMVLGCAVRCGRTAGQVDFDAKVEYLNVNFEPKCSLTVHENP